MSLFPGFLTKAAFEANRGITFHLLEKAMSRTSPSCPYGPESKILYVAASCLPYHISGYTSRTHEILHAMKKNGIAFCALTKPGYPWDRKDILHEPAGSHTEWDGVEYWHERRPDRHSLLARYAFAASRVVEKHARKAKCACVHAASNHANAIPALLAARRLGLPFRYEMRGLWELTRASRMPEFDNSPGYHLGLDLEGFVARHADVLYVLSRQLGLYAKEHWGIDSQKIKLLPNCVDGERVRPLDVAVDADRIGYAGSLICYEGLDTLISALRILGDQGKILRLDITGDGEARGDLEKLAARLGLKEQIRFFGRLDPEEARQNLARCALVCIPRRPFKVCEVVTPLKLVEAMALAKPVLVPDLPVFRDELGELAEGWMFKSGDAEDLAGCLFRIFASPETLERQGQALRKKVLLQRQWHEFGRSLAVGEIE